MKLTVGERLEGAGPAQQPGGYVVTAVVRETAWHTLYAGKKIFYNFDFAAKRVRETDEVEWLDVFLRTNRYPILDDPTYVQQRRALARAEVRAILGNRHSNLWPEPLDLLEIENTRDPFTFSSDGVRANEPIVVYARPQGSFTSDWQQQILPLSSIFSVLAELLEFLKQAHAEGLLLLGLGPSSLLIDASDRVHYVGTELVLSQQSALLKESTPAALWARLFPADRFARGYSAPECFDPAKRPDVRSDLYAWGAIAYSLLTGADLCKNAVEQNQTWTTFGEAHWVQLEKLLTQLPANSLHGWAEQVGIDPAALLESWPRKFLAVFRQLLSADPNRRPRSVAELQACFTDPPPPPIAGLIALHTGPDEATLLLDCTGLESGLTMSIQCDRGTPPLRPTDGAIVADGPLRPITVTTGLPLTLEPIYFTAFTRREQTGGRANSPGVSAQLWKPDETNLRQWVEEQALATLDSQQVPMQVSQVLGVLDIVTVADSLLASSILRVRIWGLRRVADVLRTQGFSETLASVLWRFLADRNGELRQSAAALLWSWHPRKTDDLLMKIVETLESPPIDAPVPIIHFLRHLQLPDGRIRGILEKLEARLPTACPLCGKALTQGERGTHLQNEHGYLLYQGDLLPAQAVSQKLWGRVFEQLDLPAHEDLVGMYFNLPEARRNQDAAIERYVADLEQFMLGAPVASPTGADGKIPVALPYAAMITYQANLRGSRSFLTIARALLGSASRQLREIGAQTVLPYFQEQLRGHASVADLRRLLGQVCSDVDEAELQIDLCRQLAQHGIEPGLANACIVDLQEERIVACEDCQAEVRAKDLEMHLRRTHQVFQFRGTRSTYTDTREAILHAVCAPPPDVVAWRSLQSLAEDKHPDETDRYLVVWLYQHVKEMDAEQRGPSIAAIAEVIVAAQASVRLMPFFAGPSKNASWELLGQRIALELCTRMPSPIPPALMPFVLPFLDQQELPRRARENATLALLRSAGKEGDVAAEVLRAFVSHTSKKRGIEKLHQLEQRFGHSPAIDAITKEVDDEIRMSCPRCPTELRKKDMVGHLWDKHRLWLDGQRVREPWRVIEDWVVDYGLEKDPLVLQRCRELASRVDPLTGMARLQRLLYRSGSRDRELLTELRAQVRTSKATLCPSCGAAVTIDDPPIVQPLTLEPSRLEGYGYLLEVSERGLIPTLRIESPDAILYRGREPGRGLTRVGAAVLLIGPMIAATYLLLDAHFDDELPAALLWSVAAGLGMLTAGLLYLIWPNPRPAKERLVKVAWNLLIPEILHEETGRREWGFLHGLVSLTEEVRRHTLNPDLLLECCEQARAVARTDPLARACLAKLGRRYLADMRDVGKDPFDFVLALADECFKGKLPLSFLSDLLEKLRGAERNDWTNCDLNRLPIRLAHLAFSTDVDIDDWLNLGRAFPVLSTVLGLEHRWHWLQAFALWNQRNRLPWEEAGPALTMFDLVQAPAEYEEILTHYPDVLLYVPKSNLIIGSKGVWIEGVCVTSFQPGADVSLQKISGQYELTIGSIKIRCSENPRAYLDDIKRWLNYYFQEFLPTVSSLARPLLESRHRMWQLSKAPCPECGRALVPCVGDLGIALR